MDDTDDLTDDLSLRTDFVLDALEQAIYDRCGGQVGDLVHHSGALG